MTALRTIETIRRFALLGVRCLDAATGAPVSSNLSLRAVPQGGGAWTEARPSASGVLAFHWLPGLHDAAFGDAPLTSPPATLPFALVLTDRLGRYQDVGLLLDLPRARLLVLRLLPLPALPAPPGLLALRGTVRDATRSDAEGQALPAAFALVEALAGAEPALGLADARGEFVVALPHPDPLDPPAAGEGSPPARPTLNEQLWPVRLRFRHQPSRQRWLRPLARAAEVLDAAAPGAVPLLSGLEAQAEAALAPPLPPGAASPADGLEILVPFAGTAVARGGAADGSIPLIPAPP